MDTEELRVALERLHILEALAQVLDRRDEFLSLVAGSVSAVEAGQRLESEWGFDSVQAVFALDLQIRRFAETERSRVAAERDSIARAVAQQ